LVGGTDPRVTLRLAESKKKILLCFYFYLLTFKFDGREPKQTTNRTKKYDEEDEEANDVGQDEENERRRRERGSGRHGRRRGR